MNENVGRAKGQLENRGGIRDLVSIFLKLLEILFHGFVVHN